MKQFVLLSLAVFVVSWPVGMNYQSVPCQKEPEGIVCARPVPQIKTQEFKSEEAANEFAKALKDNKVPGVTVTKK